MSLENFIELMAEVSQFIGASDLDQTLETKLNQRFGVGTPKFDELRKLCAMGEEQGWLMSREAAGIKYGRAVKPNTLAGNFSVDVVRMHNVRGPHHVHTTGEIGAIMPISGDAKFDGKSQGWYVYPPMSDHHPTVTDGDAYILYLLPKGEIEFTGK